MRIRNCVVLGIPVQDGAGRLGCDLGPEALRAAGLAETLRALGHKVADYGNVSPLPTQPDTHANTAIKSLPDIAAWIGAIQRAVYDISGDGMPIILGGDHSLAAGTLPALQRRANESGRPLFVLWLDAHADFHSLDSTESGNLHGVPLAYATGQAGFDGFFPKLPGIVAAENVCVIGLRSVDPAERRVLAASDITVLSMHAIAEHGIATGLRHFLDRVAAVNGLLHVSLDVDFLDPSIAPGVGTTVPGGASVEDAHLVMEMLRDCGRVTSLELAELNPRLDAGGRTVRLLVDLVASLFRMTHATLPCEDHSRLHPRQREWMISTAA